MSRHTVVWVFSAESELAEIWLAAADREDVSLATSSIENVLGERAAQAGEEVAEGLFGIDCPPLRALYEILSEELTVRVLKVKRI